MEGFRPAPTADQMVFQLQNGIFKQLCHDAADRPDKAFYLIVDEINRGDIPRIFGELLTSLEKDKRDQPVWLPLSGPLVVPRNLFMIGTMNTADRSIALLDTALRRRFGFIELMPDTELLAEAVVGGMSLGAFLEELNKKVRENIGRDARNLQLGHAYFMDAGKPVASASAFARVLREDVIPLLEEYCYEDFSTLAKILGSALVDEKMQQIREELFRPEKATELIAVLATAFPDLITSRKQAAAVDQLDAEDADEAEDADGDDEN